MDFKKMLTFDDVLLSPRYSDVLPTEVNLKSKFTKNISLNLPFVSAAMDTVTEHEMAIAMAVNGGIGVIHKNLSPEEQAKEVSFVKNYKFEEQSVSSSKDLNGKLLVAAAVGPAKNMEERVGLLIDAGVDVLVVDTAHGHSKGVIDTIKYIKSNKKYSHIDVIGGNIATSEAAKDLSEIGVDALKVGIGPGSICTTRIVAGTGVPQLSAIAEVVNEADKYNVPVIADGGIKFSGDAAKAFAVGAGTIMMGSLLAGTTESPGKIFKGSDGKIYKSYRGMGSLGAMSNGGKERYGQSNVAQEKFVPEGVEGKIVYKGDVSNELHQISGGVRSAMGYSGAKNIEIFRNRANLIQITSASLKESHPHDIQITKESPNYKINI